MSTFEIKQGDTLPVLGPVSLYESNATPSTPIPGGSSVVMRLQPYTGGPLVSLAGVASIDDPVAWTVTYTWAPADTAAPGAYRADFVLTTPSGQITFPTNFITVWVRPALPYPGSSGLGITAPWTDDASVRAAVPTIDAGVDLSSAILAASEQLFLLSGQKFSGPRAAIVRPTADALPSPGMDILWRLPTARWGTYNRLPYNLMEGAAVADSQRLNRIRFPDIQTVTAVKLDGVLLTPGVDYRLDGEYLVRTADPANNGPRNWPTRQRLDLDDSQPGTFSVAYTFGYSPPQSGSNAAAELAGRMALGQVTDLVNDSTLWQDGKTGLYWVDAFLNAVNPKGDRNPDSVWSPDIETGWAYN